MPTKTPALPSAVATTSGLWRRVSRVCASCVVTSAVRPIVDVRRSVPGVQRPMAQAAVAPAAVTAPRVTIWRISGASSEGAGSDSTARWKARWISSASSVDFIVVLFGLRVLRGDGNRKRGKHIGEQVHQQQLTGAHRRAAGAQRGPDDGEEHLTHVAADQNA